MSEPLRSPEYAITNAPLSASRFTQAFKHARGKNSPAAQRERSAASLIPLFAAAVLYLAGISLTGCLYLPPGPLLLSLVALAAMALASIFKAPRVVWAPMITLWIGLGMWSSEMQPRPVLNTQLDQCISDGLLRSVEGTVKAAEPVRADNAAKAYDDSDPPGAFTDTAVSAAAGRHSGELRQQIDLEVNTLERLSDDQDRMEPVPQTGVRRVRLALYWPAGAEAKALECDQRIRVVIRLASPEIFRDPGVWNRAAYLESQQVAATAILHAMRQDSGRPRLATVGAGPRTLACALNRLRKTVNSRLEKLPAMSQSMPGWLRVSSADVAMLTALLTGDRSALTHNIRIGFERTSSFHLVVVSGLHLAIMAGCIFAVARRLRLNMAVTTLLTIAASFAYAIFTGFGVPVQRSFWMVTLYLIGRLLYRHRSPLNVIGFSALCLAAADPEAIFDASFQMTLLAVTAIAGIASPLLEPGVQARLRALRNLKHVSPDAKLPPRIAGFRVLVRFFAEELEAACGRWMAWRMTPAIVSTGLRMTELLFVSAIVELALALPMAIYFHRITVYALPVNLCLLPLLTLLLPAAMILLAAIVVWPAAAYVPAAACVMLLHAGIFVVGKLGHWAAADLRLPEPAAARTLFALGLFILSVSLVRIAIEMRRNLLRWPAIAALAGMALLAVAPRQTEHPAAALLFEAIDVGQGDSLLLITPDGHTLLVDGGGLGLSFLPGRQQANSGFDTGEDVVSPALWARGIRRLDAVALSHAHHDHMGGLPAILRNFRPKELWVGENPPVDAYEDLLRVADASQVAVRHLLAGDDFDFGEARVRVVGPAVGYRPGAQPSNEDSLVLRVSYRNDSVLLAGDAEKGEEEAMRAGFNLGSTVLKVGHHGSLTSTRPEFLAAVHPLWAVISCGRRNRFGHPRQEILAELQKAHVRTYRTDSDGAVCFVLHGNSVEPLAGCEQ